MKMGPFELFHCLKALQKNIFGLSTAAEAKDLGKFMIFHDFPKRHIDFSKKKSSLKFVISTGA